MYIRPDKKQLTLEAKKAAGKPAARERTSFHVKQFLLLRPQDRQGLVQLNDGIPVFLAKIFDISGNGAFLTAVVVFRQDPWQWGRMGGENFVRQAKHRRQGQKQSKPFIDFISCLNSLGFEIFPINCVCTGHGVLN